MRINKYLTRWQIIGAAFVLVLLAQAGIPLLIGRASAASLTNTYLRLNRLSAGTTTPFRLVFKTSSAGATSVAINFTAAWTTASGSVNTTQTASSASCATDTGATALPGTLSAAGSGTTITISSVTALSATTSYCVDLTSSSAVTDAAAGQYNLAVTVGSDSTTVAVDTVASNQDQINVTANVSPSFTFALGSNAAALGALSSSSPTASSSINATVSTNASHGWQMWAADLGSPVGLVSASAGKTIAYSPAAGAAPAALTAGSEGYNLGSGSLSGTTCGTPTYGNFASGGTNYKGGGLDGTLRSLVTTTGVANACSLPLTINASIAASTPAATDYAGTITVVAAGNF